MDLVAVTPGGHVEDSSTFEARFGGAMGNVALAARRAGAPVALAGGVGDDGWGRWLLDRLLSDGVETRWFSAVPGMQTPVAFVTIDATGEPAFSVYGAGIEDGLRSVADNLDEAVEQSSALAIGSNTLVGTLERALTLRAVQYAKELGRPVCLDPNLRPDRWPDLALAVEMCLEIVADAFLVRTNHHEARELTGEQDPGAAAEALCSAGARLAVVTRGSEIVAMRGGATADEPGQRVDVVSTLGAGDAFFGTLIAGLHAGGWTPDAGTAALGPAIEAGAQACTRLGAQP
ncbi:MAG: carbohydrate kinase family protein [Solirubrobacterales bacterium]